MPPLPPVANCARLTLHANLAGQPYANVMHLHYVGPSALSTVECQAIATAARDAYVAQVLPAQTNAFTLSDFTVEDLSSVTGARGVVTSGAAGGASAQALTNNVAMCISWNIARRYKGGKPRTYLGGLLSGNTVDNRHWQSTFISNITTRWSAFVVAVQAVRAGSITGITFSCVHYVFQGNRLAVPFQDDLNGFTINSRVDSQRRRLGKT